MRGKSEQQRGVLCMIDVESLMAAKHPIRQVKTMCLEVLNKMDEDIEESYAAKGRPSC